MVGENKNRGTALAVQNPPVQARGIFHRAQLKRMRRKHPQEEYESKRSRAIPANCKSEKRAPAALRGALHRLCGNSHLLRPMRALPDNSDRRKMTHSPASKREPRASLDSELVAASLRIECASLLASYYYATPATRSRQLDRRPAFRRANASVIVAVRVFAYDNLSRKRAVDKRKVACGQESFPRNHQTSPTFRSISACFSSRHRQGIDRIPRGQDHRYTPNTTLVNMPVRYAQDAKNACAHRVFAIQRGRLLSRPPQSEEKRIPTARS